MTFNIDDEINTSEFEPIHSNEDHLSVTNEDVVSGAHKKSPFGYAVVHNNKIVDRSMSVTGAKHKAIQYGSKLDSDANIGIFDMFNKVKHSDVFTEPQKDFEGISEGLPNVAKSKKVLGVKVYCEEGSKKPIYFKSDSQYFDVEADEILADDKLSEAKKNIQSMEEREPTSSDLNVMASIGLIDDNDLNELEDLGHTVYSARQVLNKIKKLKKTIQNHQEFKDTGWDFEL